MAYPGGFTGVPGVGVPGVGVTPSPYAAYGYAAPPVFAPPGLQGAPAPYAVAPPQPPGQDELRTVFITGFPQDVKERELNNLLRFIPGYEASQMNWKNNQVSRRSWRIGSSSWARQQQSSCSGKQQPMKQHLLLI